jgi:hypothetical protein
MTNFTELVLGAAIVAGVTAYAMKKDELKEGYAPNASQYTISSLDRQTTHNGKKFLNTGTTQVMTGDSANFMSRPSFKAQLQPRMAADGVYSKVRGGLTDPDNMLGDVNKTGYTTINNFATLGGRIEEENKKVLNAGVAASMDDASVSLPAADLSQLQYGKDPRDPKTFMYDRLIFANKRRRNWTGADLIRGDLPIAPDNRGWFQVNAHANIDLRKGALQHICDCDNGCTNAGASQIGRNVSQTIDVQDINMDNKSNALPGLAQLREKGGVNFAN